MRSTALYASLLLAATIFLSPAQAFGFAHEWNIEEIYSNADGTVQFIEMLCPNTPLAQNEFFTNNVQITANSGSGNVTVTLNHDLSGQPATGGQTFVIATSTFAPFAGITPDFPLLPANFFNPNAASITIRFGFDYDVLTFAGSLLPKDGVMSLVDHNPAGASHLVPETNSPKNFAGQSGSVNIPSFAAADFTENGVVNGFDFDNWQSNFGTATGATHMQGDADNDGDADGRDFLKWQEQTTNAGAGAPVVGAVPEPAGTVLAALAGLAVARRRRPSRPS